MDAQDRFQSANLTDGYGTPSAFDEKPALPNCGKFYAVDNTGQWHYLNHGNKWQTMPSLELAARENALARAIEEAEIRSRDWLGQHQIAANEILTSLRALKDKGA